VSSKRNPAQIRVEVAYALPDRQALIAVQLPQGGTVKQAIQRSGVLAAFPEIDLQRAKVGIFGRPIALEAPVRDGDRVEIYRPLIAEPRQARRERAKQMALKRRS
jgi:hypothetical protein